MHALNKFSRISKSKLLKVPRKKNLSGRLVFFFPPSMALVPAQILKFTVLSFPLLSKTSGPHQSRVLLVAFIVVEGLRSLGCIFSPVMLTFLHAACPEAHTHTCLNTYRHISCHIF